MEAKLSHYICDVIISIEILHNDITVGLMVDQQRLICWSVKGWQGMWVPRWGGTLILVSRLNFSLRGGL